MFRILTLVLLCAVSAAPALAQDAAAGEKVFAACRVCHQVGENAKNLIGPALNGIIGAHAGKAPGFNYSPANRDSDIVWTDTVFAEYIRDPRAKMPGNKMVYPGLKDDQKIADLIAFLKQFDSSGKRTP